MGSSAATVPFSPISAVRPALSNMVNTSRRRELPPDFSTSVRPSHVVTPVASSPSLTTKRAAIRITAGSPKPASDSSKVSTPLKKSANAAPTATSSTGKRFHTNSTTTAARIDRLTVASLILTHEGQASERKLQQAEPAGKSVLEALGSPNLLGSSPPHYLGRRCP